jgi:hypothetical protein
MLFVGGSPAHQLNPYAGLLNSRFHHLVFGINNLRSDEMPYFGPKHARLGAFVQLLCNHDCDTFLQFIDLPGKYVQPVG